MSMNIDTARAIVSDAQHHADATPEKREFLPEPPSEAVLDEATAFVAAYDEMKLATHSTSHVLNEVAALVLEIAADSPQKAKVQAIYDAFNGSPVAPEILDPS